MISREQIEKYRVTGMWDDPMHWPEFIDTLDAALKVVEAAKALALSKTARSDWQGNPISAHYIVSKQTLEELFGALAPFAAPRGEE